MYDVLIEASELKELINANAEICIFDCRFSLNDTDAGKKLWQESHIPSAFYAHLDDDLCSKIIPTETGRHPLPEKPDFIKWLCLHGVNEDTQIIAYDSAGGAIAGRLWWLCRWIGHSRCAVLNGGLDQWNKIAQSDAIQTTPQGHGTITIKTALLNSLNTRQVIDHKNAQLVDAREYPRYLGEQEPIDPIAGHIPGAVSYPFPENLDAQGKFISLELLKSRFKELDNQGKELIMYCGSGVTAIHNILAMTAAGFKSPILYEDSWSGWILDSSRKIATGNTPD